MGPERELHARRPLVVGLEAINLTGEDVRWHARTTQQIDQAGRPEPTLHAGCPLKF
jgi:hypothetical protein